MPALSGSTWEAIEAEVMERARARCECSGQCGFNHRFQEKDAAGHRLPPVRCRAPHAQTILRRLGWECYWVLGPTEQHPTVAYRQLYREQAVSGDKARLVVAPLDGNRQNRDARNVLALCQRCALLIGRKVAA